jgi:hypothetical protein
LNFAPKSTYLMPFSNSIRISQLLRTRRHDRVTRRMNIEIPQCFVKPLDSRSAWNLKSQIN